jgi:choice-of-anchor B domain-containing protein
MIVRSLVSRLLLTLFSVVFTTFAQNGVTLLDSLNRPHGVSGQGTRFSACWGWVSPDGREYALIGTYTGTSIIDLNVSPIREIAFVPGNTAGYCYREFKTYKNYAYAVSEGGRGVQILDLSRLPDTSGLLVREFNYTSGTRNTLRSHTVTLADGYLYLNGSAGWSPGGMVIFNLKNDPTNPQYVGEYQPEYIHDSYVRNDTLYGAAINGGGLYVADVRNKATPLLITRISYTGSGTHHAWASINGRYAMTTDEVGTVNNLKVWDLTNLGGGPPYTPVAQYRASPMDITHNVHGRGNYAYISHYTAGMRVVDVRNPAAPVEAGNYDTYPGPSGGFAGCWGVYPYYPSGRWIGSDMQTGLYLCNFTGLAPRIRSPLLAPTNLDTLVQGVPKTFRWRLAANQAEDPHFYEVHIFGPGVDSTLKTQDTSLVITPFSSMQNGQTYRWHVWIKDEFTNVSSQDTFRFVYRTTTEVAAVGMAPRLFSLSQNYPNPFNPNTVIRFEIPAPGHVTLKVMNLLGEEVETLVDDVRAAGEYEVRFDAKSLSSGIYLYKVSTSDGYTAVKKLVLLR